MANALSRIFSCLLQSAHCYDFDCSIHERIGLVSNKSTELSIPTFLCGIGSTVKVFTTVTLKDISTQQLIALQIYDNPSFERTLVIIYEDQYLPWLVLKRSVIPLAGLGVFAVRSFKKNEFITAYLGQYCPNPNDVTYAFQKIIGQSNTETTNVLRDDYWFAHRINHGSGQRVNCHVTKDYVVKALRNINIGEELLLDYNRGFLCPGCKGVVGNQKKKDCDFSVHQSDVPLKCHDCKKKRLNGRRCLFCTECFLCFRCYDFYQTNH